MLQLPTAHNAPATLHPPADQPLPPDKDVLDLGGDDLPAPAPALVHHEIYLYSN